MIYISKKIFISSLLLLTPLFSQAASIIISSPERAVPTRQPITVHVFLDTEKKTVSGIAGNFSFPSAMFSLGNISTEGGVVPLWVSQPNVSEEKYFDSRTHITFEGIFPGGYSGVRSPYYSGEKPGILFTVTLIPKDKGVGVLLVDDILLNSFSEDASPIPMEIATKLIAVPTLLPVEQGQEVHLTRISNKTLSAFITRDPLVNGNAWYLVVDDKSTKSAVTSLFVAETNDYNAEAVSESAWRTAKNPYVLLYQSRTKNTHIKIVYADNTYTTTTIYAVENFASISYISRILVSVAIVLFILYLYGKDLFIFGKKKL